MLNDQYRAPGFDPNNIGLGNAIIPMQASQNAIN
jgi:hypothetical protein